MTPFDRLHTSSYSFSIVTMAVSCIVFELKRDINRKTPIFHKKEKAPSSLLVYDLVETSRISKITQTAQVLALLYGAKLLPKRSILCVGCINVTYRQGDRQQRDRRQTDRRTDGFATT